MDNVIRTVRVRCNIRCYNNAYIAYIFAQLCNVFNRFANPKRCRIRPVMIRHHRCYFELSSASSAEGWNLRFLGLGPHCTDLCTSRPSLLSGHNQLTVQPLSSPKGPNHTVTAYVCWQKTAPINNLMLEHDVRYE